jgi:hypothetical protein
MQRKRKMCMYHPVTVCSHYLAIICIYMYVINNCLSSGSDQQEDLGKPS